MNIGEKMIIDKSSVQLILLIIMTIFSALLLRASNRVNKEREKERADRKNHVTKIKTEAS
jgi:hypothetical protein